MGPQVLIEGAGGGDAGLCKLLTDAGGVVDDGLALLHPVETVRLGASMNRPKLPVQTAQSISYHTATR